MKMVSSHITSFFDLEPDSTSVSNQIYEHLILKNYASHYNLIPLKFLYSYRSGLLQVSRSLFTGTQNVKI